MIKIYSTKWCGPCKAAKSLLDSLGYSYEVVDIEERNITREQMMKETGGLTVPQIIINGDNIGGFDSLRFLVDNGKLEEKITNVG